MGRTVEEYPIRVAATVGPCLVRLSAPGPGFEWNYRIPEGLGCAEGVFKSHAAPIVEWQESDDGACLWHEWETDDYHYKELAADELMRTLGLVPLQGIRYRVEIRACDYGLALSLSVTNISEQTFHNVTGNPCLGHPSADFEDGGLERTFIMTGAGLTALKHTDRGSGDPIRTHYHVNGAEPVVFYGPPFWGEAGSTTATSGSILRTSRDGRWTIGTGWETTSEIFQNEDSHHCIHSVPALGDIQPGETKTARGHIVFLEGTAEEGFNMLGRALGHAVTRLGGS